MGRIDSYPNPMNIPFMSGSTLAYSQITASSTSTVAGTTTDIPGLEVTVTVPAGRRLRITAKFIGYANTLPARVASTIREGSTVLGNFEAQPTGVGMGAGVHAEAIITPSAGMHTYKVGITAATNTGFVYVDANLPGWILVEDITGGPDPYPSASVPVGQLGYAEYIGGTQTIGVTGVETDLTGLSVNVVVPAGRILRASSLVHLRSSVNTDVCYTRIRQDGAGGNAEFCYGNELAASPATPCDSQIFSPSAGAHTYKVTGTRGAGTGSLSMYGAAGEPSWIMVEDITPTPAPANTAPSSTLAYAEATANQGSITAQVALTGLSVAVNVAAGRRIRISGEMYFQNTTVNASAGARLFIKEGGTQLQQNDQRLTTANVPEKFASSVVISPSAGSHTYSLTADNGGGGSVTMLGNASYPAFILVEDITGSGISGHTHSQLDDTGWIVLPFLNNWVSYDNTYGPAGYRKIGKVVYLRGLVKNGTSGTAVIAKLPVGFRPGLEKLRVNGQSNEVFCQYDIQGSTGDIIPVSGVNTAWTSLNNISFTADQ